MAAVLETGGIGAARIHVLKRLLPTAEAIWKASHSELLTAGLTEDAAEKLTAFRREHPDRPMELQESAGVLGITLLSPEDELYPTLLKEIHLPPPILFCQGDVSLPAQPAIAVVGARKASPYGKSAAAELSRDIAGQGFTIVSGGARGIDSAAHQGALLRGRTIAVLGCGVDVVYPRENAKLFAQIREEGLIVSEYTPGTQPLPAFFPMRNRIIAGLSKGTVVVEAAKRSGSLITAELSLSEGRDVFAVPGSIYSETSAGTNHLIQQGAKLVTTARDVVGEYMEQEPPASRNREDEVPAGLSTDEIRIYKLLSKDVSLSMDEIIFKTHGDTANVAFLLLGLQLKGVVAETEAQGYLRAIR